MPSDRTPARTLASMKKNSLAKPLKAPRVGRAARALFPKPRVPRGTLPTRNMNPLPADVPMTLLPHDAEGGCDPALANELFRKLVGIFEGVERRKFRGKLTPRKELFIGPKTYRFSGKTFEPHPFFPELERAAKWLSDRFLLKGAKFTCCHVNLYEDKYGSVDWHADDEPEIDQDHPIVSLTLGTPFVFEVRKVIARDFPSAHGSASTPISVTPGHGDVVVMHAGMQAGWQHRVKKILPLPKKPTDDPTLATPRINLTFRVYK